MEQADCVRANVDDHSLKQLSPSNDAIVNQLAVMNRRCVYVRVWHFYVLLTIH